MTDRDRFWMQEAIRCAEEAEAAGEVPVGAVLVSDDIPIARGWNKPIQTRDPSLHAEMDVIRQAAKILENYRLPNTTLYVTLEPCAMCAGLIQHARIARVVFGAFDEKAGACGSVLDILNHPKRLHKIDVTGGILIHECRALLQSFFKARRKHADSSGKKLESASSC
ncbi:MAG: tRNA adenosine(34) deaminase TadA [Gammaproteobacteria bacterium]